VHRIVLALALSAVVLSGCGPDADRNAARAVTDRFFAALSSGDGEQACAQLSPDTRAEVESQEQKPCREAITGLGLEGGSVARVDVYMFNAMAELSNGDAAFLDEGEEGWRLSAVGCKDQGKPTARPYDCDVED
jgi:ketosteroid isomerase-like protein